MTLTFDPLTLNMYGRWGVMWSIYIPNLNKIGPSAAELLTINYRFIAHFRRCSNLSIGDLKKAWTDLHQIWWGHCQMTCGHAV